MKNKKMPYLILPVITLILEILPYGAVLNFANPDGEPWRKTFSYFSLTPFGYANFSPFFTAVVTCVVLLLLAIYCINGRQKLVVITERLLYASIILSLCPLMLGVEYFSLVGGLITASLLLELILLKIYKN